MGKNLWLLLLASVTILSLISDHHQTEARAAFGDDDDFDWAKDSEESEEKAVAAPVTTAKPAVQPPIAALIPSTSAPLPAPKAFSGEHQHQMPGPSNSNVNSGFQSGNNPISGYNETCGHSEYSQRCDGEKNMACSMATNKCICDESSSDHYVYVKSETKCLQVSARSTDFSCRGAEQCQRGPLGLYSSCVEGRCECIQNFGNSEVIRHEDKCYLKKRLGDYCETAEQCVTISGKAICELPPQNTGGIGNDVVPVNATKVCLCEDGYVAGLEFDTQTSECLPKGTENSQCKVDLQCTSAMGALSRCFQERCECRDVVSGKSETVFHQGKCYIRRELQGPCNEDIECQASHPNSECVRHPSYAEYDKVCVCPEGKTCEKSGAAPVHVIVSLYLMIFGLIATKVVL